MRRFIVRSSVLFLLSLVVGYSNGTTTDLGTLGGNSSIAFGINNSGQVVGQSATAGGGYDAFLYSGGTMNDLGTLPAGGTTYGRAINSSGEVVGFAALPNGNDHAFLYSDDEMTDLGTLPGGTFSQAVAINDEGEIVGTAWTTPTGGVVPVVFENGSLVNLDTCLINPPSGWRLGEAYAINDNGQIVCSALYSDEVTTHAFLLTPTPEPSSLALLAAGALGLAAYAWRKRRSPREANPEG